MSYEEQIRGALARAYTYPENSSKVLDNVLLEAMTQEMLKSVGFIPSEDKLEPVRPKVKSIVKNPNGSIDIFFQDEFLLPINIELKVEDQNEQN